MSYSDALRAMVAAELDVAPDDIHDVDVRWDSGERYDPTYGAENVAPTFDIWVKVYVDGALTQRHLDTEFTLTALLRALLGTGK